MTGAAPPVVMLMGPTASGKTALATELVQQLPLDIVSVDSAMVYRQMDIGTAKPSAAELRRAPHRLIDFLDPAEPYSAARFVTDARREIGAIHAQGRVPLLVGGTMLYFRALQQGLSTLPPADADLRAGLTREAQRQGWPALHARLQVADPEAAAGIHPNDAQRIQRALEIVELTGVGPSVWHARAKAAASPWRLIKLGLAGGPRSILRQRIAKRFQHMMQNGFLEEVRRLHQRDDLGLDSPSMRAVGYRQLWQHLQGQYSLAQAVDRGITASHQLAKRQMTWLRRETDLVWLDSAAAADSGQVIRHLRSLLPGL